MSVARTPLPLALIGQLAFVASMLMLLAFAPPAQGAMLLVPLDGASAATLLPRALAGGGRLLAEGPLRGSFVVYGDRTQLSRATAGGNVLLLGAVPILCGTGAA
jgi:hypothetical protein